MTDPTLRGHSPPMADLPSPAAVVLAPRAMRPAQAQEAPVGAVPRLPTFDEIYQQYFDFVWRSLHALGFGGPALQDALQDVFLTVHRRLESFQARSSMQTWLYGIVRLVARNHWRRRQRKGRDEPLPASLPASDPGPDRKLEEREAMCFVQDFLGQLDEHRRQVFLLCEMEQLPAPQVAEMLGVKLNTVYSRLRLARRDFRRAVAKRKGQKP